ncbi:Phosphoglucomutase-2 [Lamellibrachia satsuma]|nr:Phosphoglucomutase-2 [Lamellibrachia satsuma]
MGEADVNVKEKINEWLDWDKNETTRSEIQKLDRDNDYDELRKRLSKRLEFGTAGLRARMGAGYCMMNDLTIIQTTQGFAKYMLRTTLSVQKRGVVIGFDARHNSHRFAWLVAAVLLNEGIPVHLFSQICCTPFVPYTILKLKCDWGIMVTASHNPKEDNGYKIIPPHDHGIAEEILHNLKPFPSSWDTSVVDSSPLRTDPYDEIWTSYMQDLKKLSYYSEGNSRSSVVFTYTAMHGVGYKFIIEAFKMFGFKSNLVPVMEQVEPDPEFPTVKFPNPEEGKSALELAMKTADKNGSRVILANDPDADRLAVAEKLASDEWYVFTGVQLGAMLYWWMIQMFKANNKHIKDADVYCIASTVSSTILKSISAKEGFNFVETLTGFKWMANKATELMAKGKTVLFAFEEAIGFMCGTTVLDKDGVSAAMVMAEMTAWLAEQGVSLRQKLDDIYNTYGFHLSNNSYYLCYDPLIMEKIFDRLRNYEGTGKYPSSCGSYSIKFVRDLTTGFDNSQGDHCAILPVNKSSQMITFTFNNGCILTLRGSGTEPKLKYYAELSASPSQQ